MKIKKRLDWFDKDVIPAIEFFKQGKFHNLIEVKGERSAAEVLADIVAGLETQ